jgi:UDP-glucose 4-epimerase
MRVVLTGSSGRVGRAIFNALAPGCHVIGIDRSPASTTEIVSDFSDEGLLRRVCDGADAIIHVAALHAPHVGILADNEFVRINVDETRLLAESAMRFGVQRFVFTSTTALYGHAISKGRCTWIDENTLPQPKSIYHQTKLAAERVLEDLASSAFAVRVLRMSRCFPEPGNIMAVYRLHRGVDVRDVASAHFQALTNEGPVFQRHIISGATPFSLTDCDTLESNAASVIEHRAPALAGAFKKRGWRLPTAIDRVYQSSRAYSDLDWRPRFSFDEVLAQLDRQSLEVLPYGSPVSRTSE